MLFGLGFREKEEQECGAVWLFTKPDFFFFYPLSCQSIFLDLFFPRFTLHHLICTLRITNQSTNRRKKRLTVFYPIRTLRTEALRLEAPLLIVWMKPHCGTFQFLSQSFLWVLLLELLLEFHSSWQSLDSLSGKETVMVRCSWFFHLTS